MARIGEDGLTLLGAVGEALGYDRHLKSNTSGWILPPLVLPAFGAHYG
jgi:hypothetical protein